MTDIEPPDDARTLEWLACLGADRLPHRLVLNEGRWVIEVPDAHARAAWHAIEAFERDNLNWPPTPLLAPADEQEPYDSWSAYGAAFFLLVAFTWMGPYTSDAVYLRAGAADAQAIVAGEIWRTITALLLHADLPHLMGNVLTLALLGTPVCRFLGGGVGLMMILLTGIIGNALVAISGSGLHISVGASTATFGALGLLCGRSAVFAYRKTRTWRSVWSRAWLPIGAGVAMMAFTGASPGSDVLAHIYGFLVGLVLILPLSWTGTRRVPDWLQRGFELGVVFVFLFAWKAAFESVPFPS
jgi:rhomboid protease GluP